MKLLLVIALIAIASAHKTVGHPDMVAEINSMQDQWVAGENQFTGMDLEEFQRTRLGLIREDPIIDRPDPEAAVLKDYLALPTSFDSRTQWKGCIHSIRDQAGCGSCWAFSASEVLTDRFCIETDGAHSQVLSPQHMVSCSDRNLGCDGGYLTRSWNFMCRTGVVSDACYPYTSQKGDTGTCYSKCPGSGSWEPSHSHRHYTYRTISDIKQEIYTNGPIQTGYTVFEDFMTYKSGVYKHTTGVAIGGHAIKIVGWGKTAAGVDYWICANSWTTGFGLDGYFWFEMGQTDSGFEDQGIAGKASLDGKVDLMCYL